MTTPDSISARTTRSLAARKASPKLGAGSELIHALEVAWGQVRNCGPKLEDGTPELPPVAFVSGSGLQGNGTLAWAHFMPEGWKRSDGSRLHEVFISGERLATGASFTLQSLLHEAAHLLAHLRGIKDCSRGHAYHNGDFLKLAQELGLEYLHATPSKAIGYSDCTLTQLGSVWYAEVLTHLEAAIRMDMDTLERLLLAIGAAGVDPTATGIDTGAHTLRLPKAGRRTSGGTRITLVCACPSPRRLQVSRTVADEGDIGCGVCLTMFLPRDEDLA